MPRRHKTPKKSREPTGPAMHKVCNKLVSRMLTRSWLNKAFEKVCPHLFVYWIAASHIKFWNAGSQHRSPKFDMSRYMEAQLKLCIFNLCVHALIQTFINTFECAVLVPLHTKCKLYVCTPFFNDLKIRRMIEEMYRENVNAIYDGFSRNVIGDHRLIVSIVDAFEVDTGYYTIYEKMLEPRVTAVSNGFLTEQLEISLDTEMVIEPVYNNFFDAKGWYESTKHKDAISAWHTSNRSILLELMNGLQTLVFHARQGLSVAMRTRNVVFSSSLNPTHKLPTNIRCLTSIINAYISDMYSQMIFAEQQCTHCGNTQQDFTVCVGNRHICARCVRGYVGKDAVWAVNALVYL